MSTLRDVVAQAIRGDRFAEQGEVPHAFYEMADRVLAALPHYEEIGVDFCQVHQGVRNEDESTCDMNQGRNDLYECEFDSLFVRVTRVGRPTEEAPDGD